MAKGDALVMETSDCLANYLHADDLKERILKYDSKLDFVFIATCHSEFAAKIFLDAGAKHVIGIKQKDTVRDDAVITFTHRFYSLVW